jgi:PASTA domain
MSLIPVAPVARRTVVMLACAVAGALSLAGSAGAQCYSSTPSSTSYADSPFDGDSGLAPEIATVGVAIDAACDYSVNPGVATSLFQGEAVFEYINTDGNASTGSPVFNGADVAIGSLGVNGADPPPLLGRWDPATATFSFTGGPSLSPVGNGGFSATLDQLGVTAPLITGVMVGSIYQGIYDSYSDFAPNPGLGDIMMPVAFSTVAPVPVPVVQQPAPVQTTAPAVTTTPVTATSTPTATSKAANGCKVPAVKKLRTAVARAALKSAGCKLGETTRSYSSTVAAGRVIATLPKAGTKSWTEPVDLVVSKGRRPKHRSAHAASAPDLGALLDAASRRMDAAAR